MKRSYWVTPRTLADCEFPVGYASIRAPRIDPVNWADRVLPYVLAFCAGFGVAMLVLTR